MVKEELALVVVVVLLALLVELHLPLLVEPLLLGFLLLLVEVVERGFLVLLVLLTWLTTFLLVSVTQLNGI